MINFKYYNHLGFHNPYYILENNKIKICHDFQEATHNLQGDKQLDFTAVAQILNKGYAFGDRTLIKGLSKSPWMAKPDSDHRDWAYHDVPNHSEKKLAQDKIADEFFLLLKQEMLDYIANKKSIGILLTGGMDSRIVACVLNDLIKKGEVDNNLSVTGITWGKQNSRDVVYASRIANIFKWDWKHLTSDASSMMDNFHITVKNGCEYSPIHLHAMSQISKIDGLDCVIAGSFGDSIGRGEYSGVKVANLKSHANSLINFGGFFRKDSLKSIKNETNNDVKKYHQLFPQRQDYQQNEQDYQLHYMRRMLNVCMSIIDKEIPLYQMFSAPSVFGFMWSLNPTLRNDFVYKNILETYGKDLQEIPWARTGLKYPETEGQADGYSKRHHDYEEILRNDVLPKLKSKILSDEIAFLNFFNMKALEQFINLCEKKPIKGEYFYEDKLFWIAALAELVQKYRLKSSLNPSLVKQDTKSRFITTAKYYYKFLR